MANNPVSKIDPNGGYMVASDEGMAQRQKFVNQWQEYVFSEKGQAFIRQNYLKDYETLAKKYLRFADDLNQKSGGQFLEALLRLNNDYLGMGLSGIYLASGSDRLTGAAILKNKDLFHTLQEMNGEAQRVADAQNVVDAAHRPISNIDAAEQDFINDNNQKQRNYVNKWRQEKWAKIDAAQAAKKAEAAKKGEEFSGRDSHFARGTSLKDGERHESGYVNTPNVQITLSVFGPPGSPNPMAGGSNFNNNSPNASSTIEGLGFLLPDAGAGITYAISYFNSAGVQMGATQIYQFGSVPQNANRNNAVSNIRIPAAQQPVFNNFGGTIQININLSNAGGVNFDGCWNVRVDYWNQK